MRRKIALAALAGLLASGCTSVQRTAPKPALTRIGSSPVTLPGLVIGGIFVIEDKWDQSAPYHFIVDTGSSVTLVSPEFAGAHRADEPQPPDEPRVRVKSAQGGYAVLKSVTLKRLQLGKAKFDYVPALIYDCSDLSSQFGMRIDGVLGFPLFRNAVLTLDYPDGRAVLRSRTPDEGLPGEPILFDNTDKTPLIPIRLGGKELAALVDSGSESAIDINPAGLSPRFLFGPVDGPLVSTLAGDSPSRVGRLDSTVGIGSFDIRQPVAGVTDELTSIGGGILSQFTVTFDQRNNQVFFQRDDPGPLSIPSLRGTGMSFHKTPAYWRVAAVIPGSPAAQAGIAAGDLVSRIDGEAVDAWDPARFEKLVRKAERIDFSFIDGSRESAKSVAVTDIVP